MSLRPRVVGMVAVTAVVLLAACGSSSKSSTTQPSTAASTASPTSTSVASSSSTSMATTTTVSTANFNSCSVVTQAEARGAIGGSVSAGALGTATVEGGLACVFYGPSAPTPHTPNVAQPDSVRVVVVKGAGAVTWYNDYKTKVRAQPVTGYGDQAYWDGGASLSILKGNSYLRIAVSPAGAAPSLSDEKQLATAILPKL
jgi:hypothetical protein